MRSKLWLVTSLGLFSIVLVACGGASTGTDVPEEILIGGTLPKTGRFEAAAAPFDDLANAWADQINAEGGIFLSEYDASVPVRFIFYDDQSSGDEVVGLYEKLVTEDNVHLLIGPYSSPLTIPATAVAQNNEIPMILVEANSDVLYSQGNEWVFGVLESGTLWAQPYLDMLSETTDAQTIAFVGQDNPHTAEVFNGAVAYAEELGFEVVFQETTPQGDTIDFTAAIAQIIEADPDIVYVSAFENVGLVFAQQAAEQGVDPSALHIIHHGKAALGDPLGDAAEGITGEIYWAPTMDSFANIDLFNTIQQESGVFIDSYPWTAIRMFAFDGINAALEEAGSLDPVAIRDAFRTIEYESIGGTINFDDTTGQGTMGPYPAQYQSGDIILVWPPDLAAGSYVYPRQ